MTVRFSGRRKWQPTPVLLPGKFHGWRSLVGYSPWGCQESEQLHFLSLYNSIWRRKWQPTPVFLPGESHGRRSLVGYTLWGCKESDTSKQLTHTHTHNIFLSEDSFYWEDIFYYYILLCTMISNPREKVTSNNKQPLKAYIALRIT